jgi:hypothetical protein
MSRSETDGAGVVRVLARLVGLAGLVSVASGMGAWVLVRSQIAEERIVVAGAGGPLAGRPVRDPVTAFAQADAIKRASLAATGGRTYGELDASDPNAEMALHAALLRASLFTSILAFGLAAAQVAVGGVLLVVGRALGRLAER